MKQLRTRLFSAGVMSSYLDEMVFPSWWDDSIASTASGLREAAGYISSRLGFSLQALLDPTKDLTSSVAGNVKYKRNKVVKGELSLATNIGISIARTVALSYADNPVSDVPSAGDLRDSILNNGKTTVELNDLLDSCWKMGIPVVFIKNLPTKSKPDALTTMIGDRPVIVIMQAKKYPSWISFILAHELGHIHRKHLEAGQTIVDDEIKRSPQESEEREANEFAAKLVANNQKFGSSKPHTGRKLAQLARTTGAKHNISPGAVALNYAFNTSFWGPAVAALNELEGDDDAQKLIRSALERHIDTDNLSEDEKERINRVSGAAK